MASFNKVIMAGNLTRDPEFKEVGTTAVCRLSIASNRQFKNKQEVCYIEVDVWGVQAENCNKYLQKGRPVLVEGRLKLDVWEQEGQTRRKHLIVADRVVFLGAAQASYDGSSYDDKQFNNSSSSNEQHQQQKEASTSSLGSDEIDFKDEPPFEDELPF